MQRKGHPTWHHNEMPENHSVIWPGWAHVSPEQLAEDVNWLFGQGIREYVVSFDTASGGDYGAEVTGERNEDGSLTITEIRLTPPRGSDAD